MTEGDKVETEEVREKEEQSEANALMTLKSLGVSLTDLLQLVERGCLLEGDHDRRGNTEGENQKQGERDTQNH